MAEFQLPKLATRVRFPSSAPKVHRIFARMAVDFLCFLLYVEEKESGHAVAQDRLNHS